tara:strand:+ start:19 stop:570 length:552 start_codon:yes stop_codon:yes gene_type:complete
MSAPDFIGVYDNALSSDECDELISFFHRSEKTEGLIEYFDEVKVDQEIKKNIELKESFITKTPIVYKVLCKCINEYNKEYSSLNEICKWNLRDAYTFQMFKDDDDGYKLWHCEHGISDVSSKRILAWMFYLNDAKSGTEFMHFPTVQAKKGRCIIWPSAFTHLHKSAPNKGLKYIMSGWISYI